MRIKKRLALLVVPGLSTILFLIFYSTWILPQHRVSNGEFRRSLHLDEGILPIILTPIARTPKLLRPSEVPTPFPRVYVVCPSMPQKPHCWLNLIEILQNTTSPLLRITSDRLVLLADDDVVFDDWSSNQLSDVFHSYGKKIVISSSMTLWTTGNRDQYAAVNTDPGQEFYVNSGLTLGRAGDVVSMLQEIVSASNGKANSQRLTGTWYLEHRDIAALDVRRTLFFSLSDVCSWFRPDEDTRPRPPTAAYLAIWGSRSDEMGHLNTVYGYDWRSGSSSLYITERLRVLKGSKPVNRTHWLRVDGCRIRMSMFTAPGKPKPSEKEEEQARNNPRSDLLYWFSPSFTSFAYHANGGCSRRVFTQSFDRLSGCNGRFPSNVGMYEYVDGKVSILDPSTEEAMTSSSSSSSEEESTDE